jgi:hypothetical protein
VSDGELRDSERAVAEGGGAEARLAYARLLQRSGGSSDAVISTLLPALDEAAVQAELARLTRERECLDVEPETACKLVASLDHAGVVGFLRQLLTRNKAISSWIFDCLRWNEHAYSHIGRRRARTLAKVCLLVLNSRDRGAQLKSRPLPPFESLSTQFDEAREAPDERVPYEVRVRTVRERTFFDAFQPSEYDDVPHTWTVIDRRTGRKVMSFRASTGVGRVAVTADGRFVVVLCNGGQSAAVRRYPLPDRESRGA